MAHSIRTARKSDQAWWRIPRDREGKPVLPRVVEHAPRPGDVHPLERRTLLELLPSVPLRFLHGLKGIELRARESKNVGMPYGIYQAHFKLIRLYSTPYPDWPYPEELLEPRSIFARCGTSLVYRGGECFLHWPSHKALARYYFFRILAHELGHHHVDQYRHKRPLPGSLRAHEARADVLQWEVQGWQRFSAIFGADLDWNSVEETCSTKGLPEPNGDS